MSYTNIYKNLKLIGTSHIARESIERINKEFSEYDPDIVCIELDNKRLQGLLSEQKSDRSLSGIKKYGFQGYLFAVIGSYLQEKLGNVVGVKPGSDMLTAAKLTKAKGKHLYLVDQDIEITLRKFSKSFTWKEKFRLVWDIIRSPFSKKEQFDLSKVPKEELVSKLMKDMEKRYPSIYRVLVQERNEVMAKNIYNVMSKNPDKKILGVIGAGHERELLNLIKKEDFKRDRIR